MAHDVGAPFQNGRCVCFFGSASQNYLPAGDKLSRRWQSLQWMSDLGALVGRTSGQSGRSQAMDCRLFHPQRCWPLLRRGMSNRKDSSQLQDFLLRRGDVSFLFSGVSIKLLCQTYLIIRHAKREFVVKDLRLLLQHVFAGSFPDRAIHVP